MYLWLSIKWISIALHHLKYSAIPSDENKTVTRQLKGQISKIRYQVGGNSSFTNICRQSTGFLRNKHRSSLIFGIPFCVLIKIHSDMRKFNFCSTISGFNWLLHVCSKIMKHISSKAHRHRKKKISWALVYVFRVY